MFKEIFLINKLSWRKKEITRNPTLTIYERTKKIRDFVGILNHFLVELLKRGRVQKASNN